MSAELKKFASKYQRVLILYWNGKEIEGLWFPIEVICYNELHKLVREEELRNVKKFAKIKNPRTSGKLILMIPVGKRKYEDIDFGLLIKRYLKEIDYEFQEGCKIYSEYPPNIEKLVEEAEILNGSPELEATAENLHFSAAFAAKHIHSKTIEKENLTQN